MGGECGENRANIVKFTLTLLTTVCYFEQNLFTCLCTYYLHQLPSWSRLKALAC